MQAINQDWWERDSTETAAVALGAGAGIDYVFVRRRGKHGSTRAQATQEAGAGKGQKGSTHSGNIEVEHKEVD